MLLINKKYESLHEILRTADEAYTIGYGLTKDEVINKIVSLKSRTSKEDETRIKNFVNYVYDKWRDEFNNDEFLFPFTFDDSKSKKVLVARAYKSKLSDLNTYLDDPSKVSSSGSFVVGNRTFEYGNGSRPSGNADSADKKVFTKYANVLKPQSIGLTGTVEKDNLLKRIKSGLDAQQILTDSMKEFLYDLCEKLSNKKYVKKNIDDLIMSGEEGKKPFEITCSLPSGANKDEIKAASKEIDKDFGEVIGAIVLLNSLKTAKSVEYDASVTGEMIDYTVNTKNSSVGVSAKALKGGHAPSAGTLFRAMREFVISGEQIGDTTFEDLLNKDYIDKPEKAKEAKEFFILMEDIVDNSTKYQWFALIDKLTNGRENAKSALNKFTELFIGKGKKTIDLITEFGDSKLERNFASKFDSLCRENFDAVADVLKSVQTACGSKSKDNPTTAEEAIKLTAKKKIGLFIYPFESYIVKELNKNFGLGRYGNSDVDIISAFARLAFSNKQIYLGTSIETGDSVKVIYKIVSMDRADWTFSTSGNSSADPFSQVIGIHVIL